MIDQALRVKFVDFWPDFNLETFLIYKILKSKYEVIIDEKPDILFYSTYSQDNRKYSCTKVFYTGENIRPNFNNCDFAFSFDDHRPNHNYRLPLYALYDDVKKLLKSPKKPIIEKTKFCCFLVSNPNSAIRNNFFLELCRRKHVDSGGSVLNNIGRTVKDKREFIRDYKFVIAFENSSYPGYVTEKIFEPLLEDCIPIYWGSTSIKLDFNPKRFINCHDFKSFNEVIEYILEVDQKEEKYRAILNEPAFNNNTLNEFVKEENILSTLDEIVNFTRKLTLLKKAMFRLRTGCCVINFKLSKVLSVFKRYVTA